MSVRTAVLAVLLLGSLAGLPVRVRAGETERGRARRLLDDLHSRFLEDRERARTELVAVGPAAIDLLGEALADPDLRVRTAAAGALGEINTLPACERLVAALEHADGEFRDALIEILLAQATLSRPVVERRWSQARAAPALELAREAFLAVDVERALGKLITDRGSYGTYAGQFAEVTRIGPKAARVLFHMFTQPGYRFRDPDPKRRHIMRSLAGEALGDVHDPSLVAPLLALFRSSTCAAELAFDRQEAEDTLAYVLFKLGEVQPITDMAHRLEAYLGEQEQRTDLRPRLTGLLVRMGDYERAEYYYRRIIEDDYQRADWARYNLACLYSIQKKIPQALRELKLAILGGFGDVEWIKQDGDLTNLHGNPEFERIIRDAERSDPLRRRGR